MMLEKVNQVKFSTGLTAKQVYTVIIVLIVFINCLEYLRMPFIQGCTFQGYALVEKTRTRDVKSFD